MCAKSETEIIKSTVYVLTETHLHVSVEPPTSNCNTHARLGAGSVLLSDIRDLQIPGPNGCGNGCWGKILGKCCPTTRLIVTLSPNHKLATLAWTVNKHTVDIRTGERASQGGVHAALTRSKSVIYNKAPLFVDEPEAVMKSILAAKEAQAGAAAPETAMAQPPEQMAMGGV